MPVLVQLHSGPSSCRLLSPLRCWSGVRDPPPEHSSHGSREERSPGLVTDTHRPSLCNPRRSLHPHGPETVGTPLTRIHGDQRRWYTVSSLPFREPTEQDSRSSSGHRVFGGRGGVGTTSPRVVVVPVVVPRWARGRLQSTRDRGEVVCRRTGTFVVPGLLRRHDRGGTSRYLE